MWLALPQATLTRRREVVVVTVLSSPAGACPARTSPEVSCVAEVSAAAVASSAQSAASATAAARQRRLAKATIFGPVPSVYDPVRITRVRFL